MIYILRYNQLLTIVPKREPIDPLRVYSRLAIPDAPLRPIHRLASRLFAVSANSASCERLFSAYGNTLTKLRNRLGTDKLQAITELKMHIRDEHIRAEQGHSERLKRRFVARRDEEGGGEKQGQGRVPEPPAAIPSAERTTFEDLDESVNENLLGVYHISDSPL